VVTVTGFVFRLDVPRVELPTEIMPAIRAPSLPGDLGAFALAAATIAFVATAESLLCAVATDGLHAGPRARLDRELFAQGAANALSGLVGGLPIAGVIVRSTANISAGAKTRLSAVLHGIWVIFATTMIGSVLTQIPLSALAGLLVVVGLKLLDPPRVRALARHGEFSTFLVTFSGVVVINLLAGIAIGFLWAVLRLLRRRSKVTIEAEGHDGRYRVVVKGAFTFLGVPTVTAVLSKIPPGRQVDIDLRVEMMDHAAFEALHAWREGYERQAGKVDIDQSHEHWSSVDDGQRLTTFEARPRQPT
jgi:carbonic anhydrase